MLLPHMTDNEIKLFKKYLSTSKKFVEFGAGGSTLLASTYNNIIQIDSIESSLDWIYEVGKNSEAKEAISSNRLHLHYIDVGKIASYGMPIDSKSIHLWPNYYWEIWKKLPLDVDCILIDGRFRMACAITIALLDLAPNVNILIHDFSSRAPYQIVKVFLEEKEKADDLSVFSLYPSIDKDALLELLKIYRLCPGDRLPGFCKDCPQTCKVC